VQTLTYSHLGSQSRKQFSENLFEQTCYPYSIRPSEKTELSVKKYIIHQSQSVDMSWPLNALFVIVRSQKNTSAAILVAKFTCIETLEEVTLISSKSDLGTQLLIILSGDRLQFVMPGPDKNESLQRFDLFGSRKTVNESSLELEPTAKVSTSVDCNWDLGRFKLFKIESPRLIFN